MRKQTCNPWQTQRGGGGGGSGFETGQTHKLNSLVPTKQRSFSEKLPPACMGGTEPSLVLTQPMDCGNRSKWLQGFSVSKPRGRVQDMSWNRVVRANFQTTSIKGLKSRVQCKPKPMLPKVGDIGGRNCHAGHKTVHTFPEAAIST